MHFIPNPANTEFIYLCGLEECVNRILNLDAVTPPMPKPFVCSQCGTDFTPTWKWDKAAKGKIYVSVVWCGVVWCGVWCDTLSSSLYSLYLSYKES